MLVSWAVIGLSDSSCDADSRLMRQRRISRTESPLNRVIASGRVVEGARAVEDGSMARERIPRVWPLRT